MWAARVVALNCPEAIRYRAWRRSRHRGCVALIEAWRRSLGVWPHLANSIRTNGGLSKNDQVKPRALVSFYASPTGEKLQFSI